MNTTIAPCGTKVNVWAFLVPIKQNAEEHAATVLANNSQHQEEHRAFIAAAQNEYYKSGKSSFVSGQKGMPEVVSKQNDNSQERLDFVNNTVELLKLSEENTDTEATFEGVQKLMQLRNNPLATEFSSNKGYFDVSF